MNGETEKKAYFLTEKSKRKILCLHLKFVNVYARQIPY